MVYEPSVHPSPRIDRRACWGIKIEFCFCRFGAQDFGFRRVAFAIDPQAGGFLNPLSIFVFVFQEPKRGVFTFYEACHGVFEGRAELNSVSLCYITSPHSHLQVNINKNTRELP